jgi:hypothetical protein
MPRKEESSGRRIKKKTETVEDRDISRLPRYLHFWTLYTTTSQIITSKRMKETKYGKMRQKN